MDRVHYRRHTPSRLHSDFHEPERPKDRSIHRPMFQNHENSHFTRQIKPDKPDKAGFREKVIVQGIISGIIFTVVLVLNLADHPQASNITNNLNQAISRNITLEQVAVEVRRFLGEDFPFLGEPAYIESADTPIGYDAADTLHQPGMQSYLQPYTQPHIQIEDQTPTSRIDEDMLREIFGWTDSDDLQTTAPEPITSPEL